MSGALLVRNGTVLSLDRSVANASGLDVLIENGEIVEVGKSLRARGADVIEAEDCVVMPGLVDAHRHVWQTLLRGSGLRSAGAEEIAGRLTADQAGAATLVGLMSAAESGTTTVVDWFDLDRSLAQAALDAHSASGLRTVLVLASPMADARIEELRVGSRTTLAWGSPALDGMSVGDVRPGWDAARNAGLRIHAHVGARSGHEGTLTALDAAGLLGSDVTLIHCTHLGEDDLAAIASSGARVVLTPAVEMTSGIGIPPVQGFVDRKIPLGLGVGSEAEAPGDVLAQMRAANSVQHATSFDLKLAGKGGVPNLLSTREVIRYGTVEGAGAAGLVGSVGTLAPGMAADLVVLRADRPNIAPINDPIGAVVWGMDPSNVDTVVVGGDVLVRGGAVVADLGSALDTVRDAAAAVVPLMAAGGRS